MSAGMAPRECLWQGRCHDIDASRPASAWGGFGMIESRPSGAAYDERPAGSSNCGPRSRDHSRRIVSATVSPRMWSPTAR